jgi:hypothetical protein
MLINGRPSFRESHHVPYRSIPVATAIKTRDPGTTLPIPTTQKSPQHQQPAETRIRKQVKILSREGETSPTQKKRSDVKPSQNRSFSRLNR